MAMSEWTAQARQRLAAMDADAPMALRHVWLVETVQWIRGEEADVPAALRRVEALLDGAEADPEWRERWTLWWSRFTQAVDVAPLLADYGFASRQAFWSELGHRLRRKCLPASPQTTDVGELFALVFADPKDARWLRALSPRLLERLAALLTEPPEPMPLGPTPESETLTAWDQVLLDALAFEVGQIGAAGFSSELRVRMSAAARRDRIFHDLPAAMAAFRQRFEQVGAVPASLQAQAGVLRERLDAARHAAYTVYAHLEEHGISVGVVFRLRQLRERVLRAKTLLDALLTEDRARATARLLAQLVQVGHDSRSIRTLVATSTQLTAARVAERSAETGEQYITRDWNEYRRMLWRAGGGGAILGFTTWFKFLIGGLALSAFWGGFAAGLNYAVAFVLIQLLHFTVATKQPAVTAPAMVARLKDLHSRESVLRFVDEVAHLFRSQVAAIAGNLGLVIPVVLVLSTGLWLLRGESMISADDARHVIDAHQLLGPTLLFAAVTGLLLFASSIVAGWVENWFVLNKLDSAIQYNPAITRRIGAQRAARWARFMRANVSGLAANISLGLMLGLVPAVALFFGLGLEVRHVTLVMGQMTAAVAALGPVVFLESAFWAAMLATLLVGPVNLAVSFYLAFRLALKSQGVSEVDRRRIHAAIRHRLRKAPLSFLWPVSSQAEAQVIQAADIPPADGAATQPADLPEGGTLARIESGNEGR